MNNQKAPPISVAVTVDERALIEEEAKLDRRPVSNLIKAIVIPELRRRRAERQPQAA